MMYKGSCFCGAVQLEVTGDPVAQGICHCGDCRSWSGGPVNAFSLWKPDQVRVTKGADSIGTYKKTERSHRKFCTKCGGHLFVEHPKWNLIDVFSATIPEFKHKPGVHVFYAETVLPIRDGVPKLRDLPKEMGGSGESVAE
jgi:hypothetical protein